jgi:hypothetical protein
MDSPVGLVTSSRPSFECPHRQWSEDRGDDPGPRQRLDDRGGFGASERSRSKTPLVRSVLSPVPTYMVTNSMFITMMPGSA